MNKNIYDTLAAAIYINAMQLNGKSISSDDQRLRAAALYDDWAPGSYSIGDMRNAPDATGNTQTWECFQAHDNAVYPDIYPGQSSWFTFWRPLHGKSPLTARPFVPVQGSHDMYRAGEYMISSDETMYCCLQDTNFSPEEYPDAWEAV